MRFNIVNHLLPVNIYFDMNTLLVRIRKLYICTLCHGVEGISQDKANQTGDRRIAERIDGPTERMGQRLEGKNFIHGS